ncbi:MAG: ThuA domain-containing protein [Candidatus Methylacidiphilales bacterium]|nr:ThuA domain-containing protein [Candidatus Methylacidiphilales bacterium]
MSSDRFPHFILVTCWALGLALSPASGQSPTPSAPTPKPPPPPPTPEQLARVDKALPSAPTAKPLKPRRLLVFSRTEGFVHSSIPIGEAMLTRLGSATGAYTAVVSKEMDAFTPESLNSFDAILFLNSTGLKFENPAHRKALLDFVASGRGVAGLHAATDNFPNWPEGQALIGGLFHGHPWGSGDLVAIKLDDPSHVINRAFDGKGFWLKEEIYQMRDPYSREKLRVVASLDMDKPENARPPEKIKRSDNDFPISWIKNEGPGRVFYTSLGHREDIYWVPQIVRHILDGIQFALGDLAADAVPSAKIPSPPLPAPAPADKTTLQEMVDGKKTTTAAASAPAPASTETPADTSIGEDALYQALRAYQFDQPAEPLVQLHQLIRQKKPADRAADEAKLLAVASDPSLNSWSRQSALRMLQLMAGPASVPALEKMAPDSVVCDEAIRLLSWITDPTATEALIRLAGHESEVVRLPALQALRTRPTPEAIRTLSQAAQSAETSTALAAVESLTAIASPQSYQALVSNAKSLSPQATLEAALLTWQQSPQPARDTFAATAAALARKHLASDADTSARLLAAKLLLATEGDKALPELIPLLGGQTPPRLAMALAQDVLTTRTPQALQALAGALPNAIPAAQSALLNAARDLHESAFRPLLLLGTSLPDPALASASLQGLALIGDPQDDAMLLAALNNPAGDATSARRALRMARSPSIIPLLRTSLEQSLQTSTPSILTLLCSILGDRQDREAFPLLLKACESPDDGARAAAFQALATLARPGDLPLFLKISDKARKSAERREWRKALNTTAATHPSPTEAVQLLETALSDPAHPARPDFIGALTLVATPEATARLQNLLASNDANQRKDVLRALSASRSQGAQDLLLQAAESSTAEDEKILALRGALDAIGSREVPADKVPAYRKAWSLAQRQEEKDAILAALRDMPRVRTAVTLLKEIEPPAPAAAPQTSQ